MFGLGREKPKIERVYVKRIGIEGRLPAYEICINAPDTVCRRLSVKCMYTMSDVVGINSTQFLDSRGHAITEEVPRKCQSTSAIEGVLKAYATEVAGKIAKKNRAELIL